MKNIYVGIMMLMLHSMAFSQVVGTWKLADQSGALGVGPTKGDISWWSTTLDDLIGRYCLFDDSVTFDVSGDFNHYMDGNTWLEEWQSGVLDNCGTPVFPHDGSQAATWSYDEVAGELTLSGLGAHMGLAKVINGAEISDPANAATAITYEVTFANSNNTMILDINFGAGYWRFVYQRTDAVNVTNPNVTFRVDMSEYSGSVANGVFLNGSFNAWCGSCAPMTSVGNGIYELTVELPVSTIQYKFTVDGWMDQEFLDPAASCVDPVEDGFDNRYYSVSDDAVLPLVCFASCSACESSSIEENNFANIILFPNPGNEVVSIHSDDVITAVIVYDLTGKEIDRISVDSNELIVPIHNWLEGLYNLAVITNKGTFTKRLVKI
jgi:hypothetical protein